MVLRQRKPAIEKIVKDLDLFVKVEEHYVEQTAIGAFVHIVTLVCIGFLLYSECVYFLNPSYKFRFAPDEGRTTPLDFYIDMTIAVPCDDLGADILDATGQDTFSFGKLNKEPTWYELDPVQRRHFDSVKYINEYLREEYHGIQELLWTSSPISLLDAVPKRQEPLDRPHDACRIHGNLTLHKVAGNFHMTKGMSIPVNGGHIHMIPFFDDKGANFSHRIDVFSFGTDHPGIIQPLKGDEKLADSGSMKYQYFVQIVPTEVQTIGTWQTYQYSVKELAKNVESDGMAGIFFSYDIFALKLIASLDREPLWQFLVKLCAGIGGTISTLQLVSGLLCCFASKLSPSKAVPKDNDAGSSETQI